MGLRLATLRAAGAPLLIGIKKTHVFVVVVVVVFFFNCNTKDTANKTFLTDSQHMSILFL